MKKELPESGSDVDVARVIDVGVQTLRNHRHLGIGLKYFRIGRSVRYLWSDVWKYIEENRVEPAR